MDTRARDLPNSAITMPASHVETSRKAVITVTWKDNAPALLRDTIGEVQS